MNNDKVLWKKKKKYKTHFRQVSEVFKRLISNAIRQLYHKTLFKNLRRLIIRSQGTRRKMQKKDRGKKLKVQILLGLNRN